MSNYSDSAYSDDPNSSWKKIFDYIKNNSDVLDVGCSIGTFGKHLSLEKGCVVDGIELDKKDFKEAKGNLNNAYNLNIETDDLSQINKKYDYIYFGDVIEHLVAPSKALEKTSRLLKTNGEVVFSIPNMSHSSVRLMLLSGRFKYGETGLLDKTHLHFYDYEELIRVFSNGGYEIVYFDPVLKDLPNEIIDKELSQVGLKRTATFMNFLRTSEASVYQFVGAARPNAKTAKNKLTKLDFSSPIDKFQILLDQTKEYYEKQMESQSKHIEKLERYAKEITEKYRQVLEEKDKLSIEKARITKKAIIRIKNRGHK
jgi:2-polyprenyl-3-methyl-5-hydroxy-6-metoxy-1,4-benzoquinol methylase